jgi:hypothetical protein
MPTTRRDLVLALLLLLVSLAVVVVVFPLLRRRVLGLLGLLCRLLCLLGIALRSTLGLPCLLGLLLGLLRILGRALGRLVVLLRLGVRVGVGHLLVLVAVNLLHKLLGCAVGLVRLGLLGRGLLARQTIGIGVVLAGLLDVPLLSGAERSGVGVGQALQRLALERAQSPLDGETTVTANLRLLLLGRLGGSVLGSDAPCAEGIDTQTKSGLGSEHAGNLALVLASCLANERGVVDELADRQYMRRYRGQKIHLHRTWECRAWS